MRCFVLFLQTDLGKSLHRKADHCTKLYSVDPNPNACLESFFHEDLFMRGFSGGVLPTPTLSMGMVFYIFQ